MTSPGLRRHNPTNIRDDGTKWQGLSGIESGFFVFVDAAHGLRAGAIDLLNQQRHHDLRTIKAIITKLSPRFENPTEVYIANVAKWMGTEPTAVLDLEDTNTLALLLRAVVMQECGSVPYQATALMAAAKAAQEHIG